MPHFQIHVWSVEAHVTVTVSSSCLIWSVMIMIYLRTQPDHNMTYSIHTTGPVTTWSVLLRAEAHTVALMCMISLMNGDECFDW